MSIPKSDHRPMGMNIEVPQGSLVVLIGISGSGKSTFAEKNFGKYAIVSTDDLRGLLSGDPGDQSVSHQAFALGMKLAHWRLSNGVTTVVDATSITPADRVGWLKIAQDTGRPAIAMIVDLSLEQCIEAIKTRDRKVPDEVVREQHRRLQAGIAGIKTEGFTAVYRLTSRAEMATARVTPLASATELS